MRLNIPDVPMMGSFAMGAPRPGLHEDEKGSSVKSALRFCHGTGTTVNKGLSRSEEFEF
jgi:hypothetical protein